MRPDGGSNPADTKPSPPGRWRGFSSAAVLAGLLGLAACGGTPSSLPAAGGFAPEADQRVPYFLRRPYEPFSRADAVATAMREWRAFGQLVDDDPPDTRPPLPAELKPERMPGMWQRVGEYWWLSQTGNRKETAWTGKHDEFGTEFDARRDGEYAWSAAFISYVMRTAGAGSRFPYSPSHATYINEAKRQADGTDDGFLIMAQRPEAYAPVVGDLICYSRTRRPLKYDNLPARVFPSHCDIVVDRDASSLTVVGGNVDDAVTMKHVPTTADGRIALPGGVPVDTRYPWMVVLQVRYER